MTATLKPYVIKIGYVVLITVTLFSLSYYMDIVFSGLVPSVRRNIECLTEAERDNAYSFSFMMSQVTKNPWAAFALFIANYGRELLFVHLAVVAMLTYCLPRIKTHLRFVVLILICVLCFLSVEAIGRVFGGSIITVCEEGGFH